MIARVPKSAPGQLKFRWAADRHQGADWWCSYKLPAQSCDSRYLLSRLSEIADELVKRGYDRSSIRFEARMKE